MMGKFLRLKNNESFKGIKVQKINAVLMIFGCLLTVLVFISTFCIRNKYKTVVHSMNDYAECTKAINQMMETSDFLTNQVRLFCINKEISYMDNYFYEIKVLRQRNHALEVLELTHNSDASDINLKMALAESDMLAKKEIYAMKLICEALEFDEDDIPPEVQAVQLEEEDKVLDAEQKTAKAQNLLFSSDYLMMKDRIFKYVSVATSALIDGYIADQALNDESMFSYFHFQIPLTILLFIVCIALYAILVFFLLIPLFENLSAIQTGIKMNLKGGYEIRYIAKAYNMLCDKNALNASALKHKAEHDPLTGLINRNAFDQIKYALVNADEPIAYLIVDIDLFKKINDQYGHLIGDEVLKKISIMLSEHFRNSDYVARIGGDEFAIIMTKFGTSAIDIIQRKISSLNNQLQNLSGNLPKVSLSVGVAFSEMGYKPELIEKADKALYKVKKGGRCNCSFYKEDEDSK